MLGFERVPGRPAVPAGELEPHLELVKHLAVPADAITPESAPHVLFRIEGAWDAPSPLEAAGA